MQHRFAPAVLLTATSLLLGAMPAHAQWKAVEQVKSYSITGSTGPELYASMGERGPTIGKSGVRAIAHTNFDLKWRRDYRPEGTSCRLVSAKPFLTITYTLPKPKGTLPPQTRKLWDTFSRGIAAHERVHGEQIREMVDQIIANTVGVTVENDPDCRKIRDVIQTPLGAASQLQRQKARDFDKIEMGNGGNVHQLILNLVNGGR
jgi:predicted secreted Zn-dependent protease